MTVARKFGGSVLDELSARATPRATPAQQVLLDAIEEDPTQPRRDFDQEQLKQLAASIRLVGILQPVGVRPLAPGRYMLTWGARRLRAAALAGLSTIPAVLTSEAQRGLAAQVIENQHRAPNSNSELAAVVARLTAEGMTNAAIATALALADPQSIRYYRVLADLPPEIAAWQDRAPVRALYELVQAWRKDRSARASIREALAAIPADDELPITVARRIVQQATGKSAGTFDKTPPSLEPAPTRPARARSDVAETASAAKDVDAARVARVRAWLADPTRPRPPLNV